MSVHVSPWTILLILLSTACVEACAGKGNPPVLPKEPESPQLRPPVLPVYATLDSMTNRALARRLAIELNDSIDSVAIESAIDEAGIKAGIDVATNTASYLGVVSRSVARAFGVDATMLHDLDVMSVSDVGLASALTIPVRKAIANETALQVERLLEDDVPFADFFRGSISVMDPSAAAFWGVSGTPAWPDRPEILVNHADGRPPLGILTSLAFVATSSRLGGPASFPGSGAGESRAGARILGGLRCIPLEHASAHDFSALTGPEVSQTGLAAAKSGNAACASCHAGLSAAGNALLGTGRHGGFNSYKTFDGSASATWPGHWYGGSVSSWQSLSGALAADEAIQSCLTQRVFEAIAQRPAVYGRDVPRMAAVAAGLSDESTGVTTWLKQIVGSPAVTSGPTLTGSKVSSPEGQVAKQRWMEPSRLLAVLSAAAPLAATDLDALGAGIALVDPAGAGGNQRFSLPMSLSGVLFDVAEAAAVAIVTREFEAGVGQSQRSVFRGIADVSVISGADAMSEAARIWEWLTGEVASGQRQSMFLELYGIAVNESQGASAGQRNQDGLAAVLSSILTSPYFLAY